MARENYYLKMANNHFNVENNLISESEDIFNGGFITDAFIKEDDGLSVNSFRESIIDSLALVKMSPQFLLNYPIDIAVIDNIEELEARFTLVYTLRSPVFGSTALIITKAADTLPLASSQSLFPAFNWAEREVWDFYGIFFTNHADLRRILTDYGFTGHPLRKDFPLSGYQEVHFDDPMKAIEYKTVELSQAFRTFRHSKAWEGAADNEV
jgi:NADH-quinone oxidoreductase subunit C